MSSERRIALLVSAALVLATFAVYGRVASFEFVRFDDGEYVYANPNVAAGLSWEGVRWAFTAFESSNWHPLTWISHQLDCELFGLDAGRHHLVNVFLHALNAVLVFAFFVGATRRLWPSAFVAAAFALHPLRVQSVAWVSERKDLLVASFFLLGLLAYLRYARRPSPAAYAGVLAAFALALLAKPTAITFPFVLLLLDRWPLDRVNAANGVSPRRLLVEKLPLLALGLGSAALTIAAQGTGGALGSLETIPLAARVANAFSAYGVYLAKTVMPTDLAFFYPHPALVNPNWSWTSFDVLGGLVAVLVLSLAALRSRRTHPWFLVGWLWFLGMLVPMIGIVQVGEQSYADRYTYLSTIGLYVALAFSAKRAFVPALGLALAACMLSSSIEATHWRNSKTLFERALETTTLNWVAETGMANVLRSEGRTIEANAHYRRALAARSTYPAALFGLGLAEHEANHPSAAIELYRRAIDTDPNLLRAHLNLGAVLGESGRTEEAVAAFSRVLALDPGHSDARANLEAMGEELSTLRAAGHATPELQRTLDRIEKVLRTRAADSERD